MKPLHLALALALGLSGCGPLYNDSGTEDPGSRWPWVCPDGAPAPDSGCLLAPVCPDVEAGDTGADAGC